MGRGAHARKGPGVSPSECLLPTLKITQQSPHPANSEVRSPLPSEQERGPEVRSRKPSSAGPKPFAWSQPESAQAEALGRSARPIFMLAWCARTRASADMASTSRLIRQSPHPRAREPVPSPIFRGLRPLKRGLRPLKRGLRPLKRGLRLRSRSWERGPEARP